MTTRLGIRACKEQFSPSLPISTLCSCALLRMYAVNVLPKTRAHSNKQFVRRNKTNAGAVSKAPGLPVRHASWHGMRLALPREATTHRATGNEIRVVVVITWYCAACTSTLRRLHRQKEKPVGNNAVRWQCPHAIRQSDCIPSRCRPPVNEPQLHNGATDSFPAVGTRENRDSYRSSKNRTVRSVCSVYY